MSRANCLDIAQTRIRTLKSSSAHVITPGTQICIQISKNSQHPQHTAPTNFPNRQLLAFDPQMPSQPTFTVFQKVQTTSAQASASMQLFNSNSSASASLPTSSMQQLPNKRPCTKCLHTKSIVEFYKGRAPLAQLDINTLTPKELSTNCRTCREKNQVHSKKQYENRTKKADDEKHLHVKLSTWESQDVQELLAKPE
jgi:hypothetical protein